MIYDTNTIDVNNLDLLLPEEKHELLDLYNSWESYHINKDYINSDLLRTELCKWNSNILNDKIWHPMFEDNSNRQKRAFSRMKKYKINVYPWSLSDVS
jgi:hypothetical protein